MEDIGVAPFRGCYNLTSVGGNEKFIGENGIVYSVNKDGKYIIEECLPARGLLVGNPSVNAENDPLLAKVGYLKEGAFEDCDEISEVDLTGTDGLDTITQKCFRDCDNLMSVILPETVNSIQDEAFGNIKRATVEIRGREVDIATNAFEHVNTMTIYTHKDSAAARYADYHQITLKLMEETYKVTFVDYDGTVLGVEFVEDGKDAVPPDSPERNGYKFTGWSGSYQNVHEDRTVIAQYIPNTGGSRPGWRR